MHAVQRGKGHAHAVQAGGRLDHLPVALGIQHFLLQRRRIHADAQRLAQHQHIAGAGIGIALEPLRIEHADRGQAVDGFHRIDAVAASDHDAGIGAGAFAPLQDAADGVLRQGIDRHADDGQREQRARTHRVQIRQGIGGGDTAEVERVVDDRHEEIGGGDDCLALIEAVHRSVVAGLAADQQFGRCRKRLNAAQQFGQHARRDLAAAATAMRERRQSLRGIGR